jgi:hypothetical protein
MNPDLDMAEAFDGLTETATLITPAASVLASDGFERDGVETETEIELVSWPTTGSESQKLPDGIRTLELRTFASTTEMRGADVANGLPAQRIRYDNGQEFDLHKAERWIIAGYWVAIGTRVGQ